ncbi:MAG: hypothetical protein JKY60_20550 [Kordiimonadaceae bacterium]|nr:hypothetical protein [Kordiimonadaceae bacterium]
MSEPERFTAGDTVTFCRDVWDYPPADGWVLAYTLTGEGGLISRRPATTEGDGYKLTFTAAETAALGRGDYRLIGRVTKGEDVHTIYNGAVAVKQNLFSVEIATDARHRLEKRLDTIETLLDGRALSDTQLLMIGGKQLQKMPMTELIVLKQETKKHLKRLRNEQRISEGGANHRRIQTRFM